LSCFDAAARHLSVTLAADELCLTQSAVSRQIIRLEQKLGCSLFDLVTAGNQPASTQSFEHFQFLVDGAVHGLGLTVLPEILIKKELAENRLVKVSKQPFMAHNYYIAIRKNAITDVNAQHFKQWLLSACDED